MDRRLRTAALDHAVQLDIAGHHETAALVLAIVNGETDEWLASRTPVQVEPITEAELDADELLWRIFEAPDDGLAAVLACGARYPAGPSLR